jgi:hypothetical protein
VAASAQNLSISLQDGQFRVTGWPSSLDASAFRVYAGAGDTPPMLGSARIEKGILTFTPRFPLSTAARYRAVVALSSAPVERVFDAAGPPVSSTRVEHIYPSSGVLPANQLKLYITFSAPMSRGDAWKHIHLLDAAGQNVPLAFVEIDQELWDPALQRLTVLFDPGRIKRGLVPQQMMGMPIVEGREYTLLIDRQWLDARGAPLAVEFRKTFRGGPVDRDPPDPQQWRITTPSAATRNAVVIDFPDPMDYALLNRLIDIPGVPGRVTIARDETEWRFTPEQPWKPGDYRIVAGTALEDLAGNHIGRAFDVDTFQKASPLASEKTVSIPFTVR